VLATEQTQSQDQQAEEEHSQESSTLAAQYKSAAQQ